MIRLVAALAPTLLILGCATASSVETPAERCRSIAAERGLNLVAAEADDGWWVTDTDPVVQGVGWPATASRGKVQCELMGRRLTVLTVGGEPLGPQGIQK